MRAAKLAALQARVGVLPVVTGMNHVHQPDSDLRETGHWTTQVTAWPDVPTGALLADVVAWAKETHQEIFQASAAEAGGG